MDRRLPREPYDRNPHRKLSSFSKCLAAKVCQVATIFPTNLWWYLSFCTGTFIIVVLEAVESSCIDKSWCFGCSVSSGIGRYEATHRRLIATNIKAGVSLLDVARRPSAILVPTGACWSLLEPAGA